MKVNTDGILLGAWANINNDESILDVGTGSGLIALMLAQRTDDAKTQITALELDDDAMTQAQQNFNLSKWDQRLTCIKSDFTLWRSTEKFDHIVSNPPYFSGDLLNDDNQRTQARHQISLTFTQLLKCSAELTNEKGKLSLILPVTEMQKLLDLASTYDWHLSRQCDIKHNEQGKVIRQLVELRKSATKTNSSISSALVIRQTDGRYSDQYKNLCRDFYLKF